MWTRCGWRALPGPRPPGIPPDPLVISPRRDQADKAVREGHAPRRRHPAGPVTPCASPARRCASRPRARCRSHLFELLLDLFLVLLLHYGQLAGVVGAESLRHQVVRLGAGHQPCGGTRGWDGSLLRNCARGGSHAAVGLGAAPDAPFWKLSAAKSRYRPSLPSPSLPATRTRRRVLDALPLTTLEGCSSCGR